MVVSATLQRRGRSPSFPLELDNEKVVVRCRFSVLSFSDDGSDSRAAIFLPGAASSGVFQQQFLPIVKEYRLGCRS